MDNNQDSASRTKFCFKIKIPNTVKEVPVEDNFETKQEPVAQQLENGGGGHGGAAGNTSSTYHLLHELPLGHRVCDYCGKIFSSGKAWGGHKRHHLKMMREDNKLKKVPDKKIKKHGEGRRRSYSYGGHKNNTINTGDVKLRDGKPTCGLCGKRFDSMQPLFGHMRMHSDDGDRWRSGSDDDDDADGDQASAFFNPSSRLDFEEPGGEEYLDEDVYYNQQTSPSASATPAPVDLTSSLVGTGWGRKGKRGDNHVPDLVVPQAARDLMTLSLAQDSSGSKGFKDNVTEIGKKLNYIDLRANLDQESNVNGTHRSSLSYVTAASEPVETGSESDGDQDEDDDPGAVPTETKFRCAICDRTFSTGQALGGHKRSHNRRATTANAKPFLDEVDDSSTGDDGSNGASNTASSGEASSHLQEAAGHHHGMLGIDLNEPYVMQDGEE